MRLAWLALAAAIAALAVAAGADELSGEDKVRMLYSRRFAFTPDGPPLLTVEIMHGQRSIHIAADGGVTVLPDGAGGPVVGGGRAWQIAAEGAKPAKLRFWTIVTRHATDDEGALWRLRGYEIATFETGALFGVEGDLIDSRETFLGVAPAATEQAAVKTAADVAARFSVPTFVHPELVNRPHGMVVAREERTGMEVRNDGVLWFAPSQADGTLTVRDVVHGGGGSQVNAEKRDTRRYSGRLYVTLGRDGALSLVNAVSEDRLLAGLVPSEIFPTAPQGALKAQAIAARGELLARIGTRHFTDPFLLCATQHCQVYGGVNPEDPRTTQAVAGTRGEVLLRDGGGGLVPGFYSASCGGFRESNDNIWGTPPDPSLRGGLDALGATAKALRAFAGGVDEKNLRAFLRAPAEAFCGKTRFAKDRYRWSVTRSAEELDRLIAAAYPDVGRVRELTALERGSSGRVKALHVVGDRGQSTIRGDLTIRRTLGGLKSTLFLVTMTAGPDKRPTSFTFDGAGFGHGVGMCQTGAIGMAEAGYGYKDILRHYYPGSHVRKLF